MLSSKQPQPDADQHLGSSAPPGKRESHTNSETDIDAGTGTKKAPLEEPGGPECDPFEPTCSQLNTVASLLKLYFRELAEPLFPTALFLDFIDASSMLSFLIPSPSPSPYSQYSFSLFSSSNPISPFFYLAFPLTPPVQNLSTTSSCAPFVDYLSAFLCQFMSACATSSLSLLSRPLNSFFFHLTAIGFDANYWLIFLASRIICEIQFSNS